MPGPRGNRLIMCDPTKFSCEKCKNTSTAKLKPLLRGVKALRHKSFISSQGRIQPVRLVGALSVRAVARVSEAPPEISRGAPHTLLAYYYELQ